MTTTVAAMEITIKVMVDQDDMKAQEDMEVDMEIVVVIVPLDRIKKWWFPFCSLLHSVLFNNLILLLFI